ncbi:hypothetical protein FBU30_009382 [Linnemannia zychae]|nr:hypothetical protein FBU30_009382 [Linnemannia zychae]
MTIRLPDPARIPVAFVVTWQIATSPSFFFTVKNLIAGWQKYLPPRENSRLTFYALSSFEIVSGHLTVDAVTSTESDISRELGDLAVPRGTRCQLHLLESENQTWDVQGEAQDHVWESMWDCVGKIKINSFEPTTIVECHKWAGLAASYCFDEYSKLLRNSPPSFPLLHQVLPQLTSSQQLWTFSGLKNEATFIRYCDIRTDQAHKQQAVCKTVDPVLYFFLLTHLRDRTCSLVHMEGKTAANKSLSQIWDDLTKLGQELKHSLDTMIILEPSGPVSVIGIHLTGYNVEFFEMTIQSEGVYIFKKYAGC